MINPDLTLGHLNTTSKGTIVEHLGIEYTEVTTEYLCAKMPVDHRTIQPFGILHGGASVVLAETLGSVSAVYSVDETKSAVGLDINANHIRPVKNGWVYGKAEPLHLGKGTQIWSIKIVNEENKLVCVARLTVAILDKK